MVRMSRKNTARSHHQQTVFLHQHSRNSHRLFSRHLVHLLIVFIFGLAIALYFFLIRIEQKTASEELVGERGEAIQKSEQAASIERRMAKEASDSESLRHHEEHRKEEQIVNEKGNQGDTLMPPGSNMILPASKVISAGLPYLVYGTAWKKEATAGFVADAVRSGFRFIDTACQPKHYNEPGVGEGWTTAANELGLKRTDLFLQTKFTSIPGQDPSNIPYDENASIEDQVRQSLQVSLKNLQTSYLDSWVMHSPMDTIEETMVVYRVMEQAVDDGKVLRLGISNCYDYQVFTTIYDMARIKPVVLQNRFYAESNWDQELRAFCKQKNIWYQSFWTLTANRHALATPEARDWAASRNLSPQTLLYAYLMSLGYGTPLDGTTSREHMEEDVALVVRMQSGDRIFESDEEIRRFERLLGF